MVELRGNKYIVVDENSEEQASSESFSKKKINKKNPKEFIPWLWTYYKWWVIIPIICIIVVVSLAKTIIEGQRDYYLKFAFVNSQVNDSDAWQAYLNEYCDSIGVDEETKWADLYRHYLASDEADLYDDNTSALISRLSAEFSNGEIDICIMNTRCIDDYASTDSLTDLRTVFSPEFLEREADNIYYYNNIPLGIRADAFECYDEFYYRDGDEYFVTLPETSDKSNEAADFIRYAVGE